MHAICIAVIAAAVAMATDAGAADPLTLEGKIVLGSVEGRIDHLAIDPGRQRLIVAELGNNSVSVIDLAERKVLNRVSGFREPQGVAYVLGPDLIYVATAGDGFVRWFKAADFAPAGQLKLGEDADNIRVDARSNQVMVGYGSGALAILDGASGQMLSEIKLPAHPESFQLQSRGTRVFVNTPDAKQIAVVDRTEQRQVATWTMKGASRNFRMAFDEDSKLLFVVYRSPPRLAVFDTIQGSIVGELPTCGDADDVFSMRNGSVYSSSVGRGSSPSSNGAEPLSTR